MPSDDPTKKRKACQNCTRAKAKCSPLQDRTDICYRCHRLGKACVFEDAVRRRGPKARSRVKQLEQRVESLIDLLAANGQTAKSLPVLNSSPFSNESKDQSRSPRGQSTEYITPIETPYSDSEDDDSMETFDPVEAGLLNIDQAAILLNEFRESFVWSFPFVVIPASTSVDALRHRHPFLFHAIIAATSYRTPSVQRQIAEEFKSQIASRIIMHSQKSLEILQGLLIYTAWYHTVYQPQTQQLSINLQLCVSMIQDLGLSKNPRDKRKMTLAGDGHAPAARSADEKRAFLGVYYLTVAFAQAWRKRTTLVHTKFMLQCSEDVAEVPSDALISPLIRLSEVISRANDYFSFDDIDNAEVRGDIILDMSMTNFRNELELIKSSLPDSVRQNTTIILKYQLLDLWVHESALHGVLWDTPENPTSLSALRITNLFRSVAAMKTIITTLLDVPQKSLYHLAFPSWSGWFYAIILACKLVFLQDNERQGELTSPGGVQQGFTSLLPEKMNPNIANDFYSVPTAKGSNPNLGGTTGTTWDPVTVAKATDIRNLFQRFVEKLSFTVPRHAMPSTDAEIQRMNDKQDRDPLFSVMALQRSLLNGFNKKMKEYTSHPVTPTPPIIQAPQPPNHNHNRPSNPTSLPLSPSQPQASFSPHSDAPQPVYNQTVHELASGTTFDPLYNDQTKHPLPAMDTMHFDSMNFDSVPMPMMMEGVEGMDGGKFDDWMWDMMMEDFTIPPF